MAEVRWEVPLSDYWRACALVVEASRLSKEGAHDQLENIKSELLQIDGYPYWRSPEDVVVLVPRSARIWVTPTHNKELPS